MSDLAIRVDNLRKQYRINQGPRPRYETLRDGLASALTAPARVIRSVLKGSGGAVARHRSDSEIWALDGVSFEVKQGEVLGIIGRNGAGKTTLLKVLSRITEPTEGSAEIHGRVGSLLEVGTGFHAELTGRENVYLNGAILGMRKGEIERKFDEIVAFSEVEKFLDTPVKHYSSGMTVRLAFAVAAHLQPEILLVDEVLAVGDVAFQNKCLGKMDGVAKEGRTVLFVSHNMAAVEQLCTRAILLSNGRVKASGAVAKVVGSYLSSDQSQGDGTEDVLARSPDGSVELVSMGPVDESGHALAMAQCGRDLSIALLLRTTAAIPKMTISIGINNLYDVRITVLHSEISGYELAAPAGEHCVVCRVPRLPLVAGGYVLDAKVYSGQTTALWVPRATQLMVEGGDFYDTGRLPDPSWAGICHLDQHWEVHKTPYAASR